MTKTEFEQLRPEFSVVIYASHNYIVAEKKNNFGVDMVGIYDEFPLISKLNHVFTIHIFGQRILETRLESEILLLKLIHLFTVKIV
jgi:hypothetical protein